jgi:hypothetical protein
LGGEEIVLLAGIDLEIEQHFEVGRPVREIELRLPIGKRVCRPGASRGTLSSPRP